MSQAGIISLSSGGGVVNSITATAPLTANGVSGTPESGNVTVALTTPLSLAYGGTNADLTATANNLVYSTASAFALLAAADNGVLISGTTGIPSWLANGTAGYVLTANSGAPPSWQAGGGGTYYSLTPYIVGSDSNSQYTTIGAAITAATAGGGNIYIKQGTYTENPALVAGVNLVAFGGDVIINGNCSFSGSGTVNIQGITLQTNSSTILGVSGSNVSIVNLKNCYLNCTNNTGISFTATNSNSKISVIDCQGDLGTTSIGLFNHQSNGTLEFRYSSFTNSGGSLQKSNANSGTLNCYYTSFLFGIITSSGSVINSSYSKIDTSAINVLGLTCLSGTSSNDIYSCGTASAISVANSGTLTLIQANISSSNTDAITGAGTLIYGGVVFSGSSSTINTTTQTPIPYSVQEGGTAASSFTAYAPVCGGTTTIGAFQSANSGISNSGYVLTSTGASSLPTWQAAGGGGITTIDGNSGSVTGSTVTITTGASNASGTALFTGSGTTLTFTATDSGGNTGFGTNSLKTNTGTGNTAVGINSGSAYAAGESGNLLFAGAGQVGDQNVMRLGFSSNDGSPYINETYIDGTGGTLTAVSPTPYITLVDASNGQIICPTPVEANTATSTFGSLSVGSVTQNTADYPILVSVSVVSSTATSGVLLVGVGPTNPPTAQTVVAAYTSATALAHSFSFVVPSQYYAEITKTGTLTVSSVTTFVTQIG